MLPQIVRPEPDRDSLRIPLEILRAARTPVPRPTSFTVGGSSPPYTPGLNGGVSM